MSAMQSTVPRVRPQTIVAEVLEPRALFSVSEVAPVEVNLSASDLTVVAPPAVIIGQKFKAGVSLAVGNAGTTAVATRGTIELFLSQDHDLSSTTRFFRPSRRNSISSPVSSGWLRLRLHRYRQSRTANTT